MLFSNLELMGGLWPFCVSICLLRSRVFLLGDYLLHPVLKQVNIFPPAHPCASLTPCYVHWADIHPALEVNIGYASLLIGLGDEVRTSHHSLAHVTQLASVGSAVPTENEL